MAGVIKRQSDKARGKAGKWTMWWIDESGRKRSKAGFTDRAKSLGMARHLEGEARRVREGLVDPAEVALRDEGRKPLAVHLADYRAHLLAKGSSPKHVTQVIGAIERTLAEAAIASAGALAFDKVQVAVGKLRAAGRSARTCNYALGAVKAFAAWLDDAGRIDRLPRGFARLSRYNEEADRKRVRRALSSDEIEKLLAATEQGPPVKLSRIGYQYEERWMSGPERAALYRLAMGTGFRANEIRTLTPRRFDLDGPEPTITVLAAYAKNGREVRQPITTEMADALRPLLAGKDPESPALPVPEKTAKLLRQDLARAGIPDTDEAGRVVDFHALRTSYVTTLIRAGVNPRIVQALARHSTITLTLGTYTTFEESEKRAALSRK